MIAFTARVGPGFYWFAAYCLFSLASQQLTVRLVTTTAGEPQGLSERTSG